MSTQRRTFLKTWWSPYLGEWRPFHDNYIYASNTGCTFSGSAVYSPVPPTPSITPSPTLTQTPSNTATSTPTNTQTSTPTNTPSNTPTLTPTTTPQITPSVTQTNTPTTTETLTATPTVTPTTTTTLTATETCTPTATPQVTTTATNTSTPTNTPTVTNSPTTTTTLTATPSQTPSITPSVTPTKTPGFTPTTTLTPSPTTTTTLTATQTQTPSITPSPTATQPAFNPSSIGNLQYWFKATDGASVSSWTNNGLIGGSLTQPTAANQPQIVSNDTFGFGYTGQSVNFTSRDWMYLNHPSSATTFTGKTFFFVANVKDRATTGWAIGIQEASGYTSSNSIFDYQFYDGSLTTVSRSRPGRRQFTFTTGSTLFAASGLTTTGYTAAVNDVVGTSASTTYIGTNAVYIGFGYDSGSANVNDISVFEFLGYNKLLTQSEFDQVLNYLKTKYAYSLINPTPTPTATITRTPQLTSTPTQTPQVTSTPTRTPQVTPTPSLTSNNYLYYNVEAYNCSTCANTGITGVLKILWPSVGGPNIGWYYGGPGGSPSYKYKIVSATSGPSYNFLLDIPWQGSANCGSITC